MSKTLYSVVAAAGLLVASQIPGHAQATRTWVSGVGDDVNPCSRTAPCKTFAGAISKTAMNGEINCLDPGGFGAVTITKSITIDCHEIFGSILNSLVNGIVINIINAADPLKTVRLRNLIINGPGNNTRSGIRGINILAASAVFVEDMMIANQVGEGILDQRTAGGFLFVNNTTVHDNGGAGIKILPASGATIRIDATLSNVVVERNTDGVFVSNGARVQIKRSIMAGNSGSGILSEGPLAASRVAVDDSSISGNGTGLTRLAGGAIRASNNDISFNTTAKSGNGLFSFGNNRLNENTNAGNAFQAVAQE
jgi:hypothetical protein